MALWRGYTFSSHWLSRDRLMALIQERMINIGRAWFYHQNTTDQVRAAERGGPIGDYEEAHWSESYLQKIYTHIHTYLSKDVYVVIGKIVKNWKQAKSSLREDCLNKAWGICTEKPHAGVHICCKFPGPKMEKYLRYSFQRKGKFLIRLYAIGCLWKCVGKPSLGASRWEGVGICALGVKGHCH